MTMAAYYPLADSWRDVQHHYCACRDVQNIGDAQGYDLAGQIQQDLLWLALFQEELHGVGELLSLNRLD